MNTMFIAGQLYYNPSYSNPYNGEDSFIIRANALAFIGEDY